MTKTSPKTYFQGGTPSAYQKSTKLGKNGMKDIKIVFFAIIHILVVLLLCHMTFLALNPPKGGNLPPPLLFSGVYGCNIGNRDKVRK